MFAGAAFYRRQGVHVSLEIDYVLDAHMGIGRIGKGGIVVRTGRGHAGHHSIDEIAGRPAADAVARIRRDIGNDEGAEVGSKPQPAGETEFVVALGLGRGVAGRAATSVEDPLAVSRIGLVARKTGGRYARRCREEPARGGSDKRRRD
jgi:hypothetical protein